VITFYWKLLYFATDRYVNMQNRDIPNTAAAWLAVMFAYVSSKMDEFNINVGLYLSLQQLSM